jgi:hypothetical protein
MYPGECSGTAAVLDWGGNWTDPFGPDPAWMLFANWNNVGFFPINVGWDYCVGPPANGVFLLFARSGPSHIVVNMTRDKRACSFNWLWKIGGSLAYLGPYNYSEAELFLTSPPKLGLEGHNDFGKPAANPANVPNNPRLYLPKYEVPILPGKPARFDDVSVFFYSNPTCTSEYDPLGVDKYSGSFGFNELYGCHSGMGWSNSPANMTCVSKYLPSLLSQQIHTNLRKFHKLVTHTFPRKLSLPL